MSLQTVITKEFAPELAGSRIGWTAVEELPNAPDVIGVNVVIATVGVDGAKHGYYQRDADEDGGESKRLYSSDSSEGFVAVSGLFLMIERDSGHIPAQEVRYVTEKERDRDDANRILRLGGSGYPDFVPEESKIVWTDNTDELLGQLKEGLQAKDVAAYYPHVYYNLNSMVGHDRYRAQTTLARTMAPRLLFAPDNTMSHTTADEVTVAEFIVNSLNEVVAEDEQMQQRLTVFSDIPASEIPAAFEASRKTVARNEREVLGCLAHMYAPRTVYLPIGFRPSGRSWPYMDAAAKSDQEAYGVELRDLHNKSTGRARSELSREVNEVLQRLEFARQGSHVLRLLAQAEQATNTTTTTEQ